MCMNDSRVVSAIKVHHHIFLFFYAYSRHQTRGEGETCFFNHKQAWLKEATSTAAIIASPFFKFLDITFSSFFAAKKEVLDKNSFFEATKKAEMKKKTPRNE